ncbi:GntR family transcriptional regulator [Streptomyces sp. NPDC051940]|uniref:GntR family transcriptional regulator n=1 Tax=Streptomyces sp. NPDC051940 TaxID=3155675 RepID=UPI0034148373
MEASNGQANGRARPKDRVAAALRERIRTGHEGYRPGQQIPTQAKLMKEFGVERAAVRQALDLLKDEELLDNVTQGAPPRVAEQQAEPPVAPLQPQAAGAALADRITSAFRSRHVTLDTLSLTTETLNSAVAQVTIAMQSGEVSPPESIRARLLVPAPGTELALPRMVEDPEDERPLGRLHRLINLHATALQHSLFAMVERGLVPNVNVQFKTIPLTPSHKLYLLNGKDALLGFYRVVPRTVLDKGTELEIYDVMGIDTTLFPFSARPGNPSGSDTAMVTELQQWFDSLWDTIAQEFTPGDV